MGRRSIVLFHKLPAIWESDARAIKKNSISFAKESYFSEVPEPSDAEFLDKLKDDIFYMLTESLSKYLEIELKAKLGGRGKRNDLVGKNRYVVVEELAKKLGFGLSKLKQLKSINSYEPSLLNEIDKRVVKKAIMK